MGNLRVRFFQVTVSLNANGIPEVAGIATPDEVDLTVNLASAVNVNTLATPAQGPARYATLQHEARLLNCLLLGASSTSSALHLDPAFKWSARHIRSFVAECAGLGLLTVAAEEFFGWRAHRNLLHHFDALPTRLIPQYRSRGIRPDLLFDFGSSGGIAGEAKGRSRKPPTKVLAEQITFMDKLLYWSHRHDDHPVVLSCAYLTPENVTVDLFSLGSNARSLLLDVARDRGGEEWADRDTTPDSRYDEAIAQARREQAVQSRRRLTRDQADQEDLLQYVADEPTGDDSPGYARVPDADHYEDFDRNVGGGQDPASVRLAAEAARRAAEIEDELYRDAVQLTASDRTDRRTVLGRSVVGSWTPLNLFSGTAPTRHLFLGVLDEELTADEISERRVDRRERRADDTEIDVDVTSRMMVAITKRPSWSPPAWEGVREVVER
ncbi:hypothetical protein [Actinomadura sp. DC4]|uniref:hypothetical protein n=1 Tax=Actinomadura sp. DC4 TaxID=3055069 RepID=UPI0025B0E462|nr:hypothetical protein [Actinomadura sp. DC4]MDN3351145.1 hypothetical protein [Actinomadura sp. DC4]